MKKISTLVLVAMLLSFILASCGTPTPPHEHTFATGWTADATGHWHGATCEHTTEKADFAQHNDADGNGKCDACLYILFTLDTVTVNAPDGVTVSANLTAQTGTDLVFTATVSDKYLLFAEGADFVEKTTDGDTATYKFKVSAVNENSEVTITKEKYVFVDEITTGEGVIDEYLEIYTYGGELTVNFTTPGTYYIYSDNEWVTFNDMRVMEIVVEEAGDVTLNASIWTFDEVEELVYNYYIVEAETVIVMTEAATDYVLPSNIEVVLQYTATEKGWYTVSFESEDFEGISSQGVTTYVSESGTIIEKYLSVPTEELPEFATSYTVSWNVEKLVPTVVQAGDNTLTFQSNTSNLMSFTATEDGAYAFVLTLDSNSLAYWSSYIDYDETVVEYLRNTYSTVYVTEYLTAGETIEFLVINITEEFDEETYETTLVDCEITDTLTVTNLGYAIDVEADTITGMVDSDGCINTIYNPYDEQTTYYVNAGEGVVIVVGDEEYSSYDFVIEANGFASFILKSEVEEATEVEIVAKAVVYEIYTGFGSNYAYDLIPGKAYTLTTYDMMNYATYIFTWDNEDISILRGETPLVSGEAFVYTLGDVFTLVNNGTEECFASFDLVDPMSQGELMIGENSVDVFYMNGVAQYIDMTFGVAGMYVINPADGEENLAVIYKGTDGDEDITTFPFEFTVLEGETATFAISSSKTGVTEDTVNFTIDNMYEPFSSAPNGAYEVKDPDGNVIFGFNFQPVDGKKYGTVEIDEYYWWGPESATYTFAITAKNTIVLWDEDNTLYTPDFTIQAGMGGTWELSHPDYRLPITLEQVSGVDYSSANDVFAGTYWVDDTNTYTLMFAYNPRNGQYMGQFYNEDYSVYIEFFFTVINIDGMGNYEIAISDVNAMFGDIDLFSGIPAYGDGGIFVWSDLSQLDVMFKTVDGSEGVQYWFYPAE